MIFIAEKILFRFGFLRFDHLHDDATDPEVTSHDFIHCTGQLLARIPVRGNLFYRHSLKSSEVDPEDTGLYWSHNFMQTKRWKGGASLKVDECPWVELTDDFVAFCSNRENRLANFVASLND